RVDVSLHNFLMKRSDGNDTLDIEVLRPLLEDAFHAVWTGKAESDGFNRLVAAAEMAWRDVGILRSIAKYLRQTAFSLSQPYVETALSKNPKIARLLVELFRARFNPDGFQREEMRKETIESLKHDIETALADVPGADDDRILRAILAVI